MKNYYIRKIKISEATIRVSEATLKGRLKII